MHNGALFAELAQEIASFPEKRKMYYLKRQNSQFTVR